jgi:RNA polymerase sigma factor (sigma-70 family)
MATTAPLDDAPIAPIRASGDEALAHLVAEASEPAFAALYERHHQALYRYARSIVRDDADAQDALQSAWTRALVALRRGQRDAPLRPWLYRIVHNEAVSLLRRRHTRRQPPEAEVDRAASAEEQVIERERFALLIKDLHALPERPRGALLMRELGGLSHEEIATALQTSVAAAKQCIYEARRDLAELAAGRATPCDDICRRISDGDRRALRGRRVVAHLRNCPSCARFAALNRERGAALHQVVPWLPAAAAGALLKRLLGGGRSASVGSTGATGGGLAAKAIGTTLAGKSLVAAALTAGAISVVGLSGSGPPVPRPTTSHQAAPRPGTSAGTSAAPVTGSGVARRAGLQSGRVTAAHRIRVSHPPGATHSRGRHEAAGRASETSPPGQSQVKAVPPGQAKVKSTPPGHAKVNAAPPGQAKAEGTPAGQAQARGTPPGQAKAKVTPPGQTKVTTTPLGQAKAKVTPPGQTKVTTTPPDRPARAATRTSAANAAAAASTGPDHSGNAHAK